MLGFFLYFLKISNHCRENIVLKISHTAAIAKIRCYFTLKCNENVSVQPLLVLHEKYCSWWYFILQSCKNNELLPMIPDDYVSC